MPHQSGKRSYPYVGKKSLKTQRGRIPIDPAILAAIGYRFIAKKKKTFNMLTRGSEATRACRPCRNRRLLLALANIPRYSFLIDTCMITFKWRNSKHSVERKMHLVSTFVSTVVETCLKCSSQLVLTVFF